MSLRFNSAEELAANADPEFIKLNADKLGIEAPGPNRQPSSASAGPSGELERDFQKWLIDELQKAGWRVHAERAARTAKGWVTPVQGSPGFPDVVAVRAPRCLAIECKKDDGAATPHQVEWLMQMTKCPGLEAHLWSPKDRVKILECIK